ncbi:MAG: hypothetical protein ACYC1C_05065 [Chloroflexota bacterium]
MTAVAAPQTRQPWREIPLMLLVLVISISAGYLLVREVYPTPREPALLWDDYILAAASLYERDGDLDGALAPTLDRGPRHDGHHPGGRL